MSYDLTDSVFGTNNEETSEDSVALTSAGEETTSEETSEEDIEALSDDDIMLTSDDGIMLTTTSSEPTYTGIDVQFAAGLAADKPDTNGLFYYATDTGSLWLNDKEYTTGDLYTVTFY